MDDKKNTIKVYTSYSGAELNISAPSTKQVISATNNRAQYFAEQAKKYRDEAKLHRDNAKYYAEQNSDVTFEYINNVKAVLEDKIAEKQDSGNYALREELPVNVSELINDAEYVNQTELDDVRLPSQEDCSGKVLMSDGENEKWVGINTFQLFDTKVADHILEEVSSLGWALQGSYVSKAIYPDFYEKCLEEKLSGTANEISLGSSNITIYTSPNGHKFYDIADKGIVDSYYNTNGVAWFYGVDTDNERIFLPRDNYFSSYIADGTLSVKVYGTGKTLGMTNGSSLLGFSNVGSGMGAYTSTSLYNVSVGNTTGGNYNTTTKAMGVTTDASKSGLIGSLSLQNTSKEFYLYICVGNSVVNEALVDIGQLSSDLQYKADKTEVDGQWVNNALILASNVACPNSDLSLDLSSWLPNDGYIYEILCDVTGRTGSTSGDTSGIAVTSDILLDNGFNVVIAQTRSASTISFATSFTIPIGTERYLRLVNGVGANTGTFTLVARAYRRLGTNL